MKLMQQLVSLTLAENLKLPKGITVVPCKDNVHPDIFKDCYSVMKKGKEVGFVYRADDSDSNWAAVLTKSDLSWDFIDSKEDAIEQVLQQLGLMEAEENDGNWPKLLSQADEFRVEIDENEQVHLLDGEQTVRVSMPYVIWKQLCR